MKKVLFSALALFMFIGNAHAYKPCDANQVRKAQAYCSNRSATYRACKAYDNGNITAVCELNGKVIEGDANKAIPLRTKTR